MIVVAKHSDVYIIYINDEPYNNTHSRLEESCYDYLIHGL